MTDGQNLPHDLTLSQRKKLTMTGALEVVSFDEHCAQIRTSLGTLVIQGQNLQLKQLTQEGGNVAVEGQIESLQYVQGHTGGWLSRFWG